MATYRIYFWDHHGHICGREDFEAGSERAAIRIAHELMAACGDECAKFELWRGLQFISGPIDQESLEPLPDYCEEIVARTEEAIRQSEWAVGRSRKLIERLGAKPDRP